jgi:CHAD domain-containing protein
MVADGRTFDVDARFSLPDLTSCVPDGGRVVTHAPVKFRTTYYDTEDLRLARAGASLRHRDGGLGPLWTVHLAPDVPGPRHDIDRTGAAQRIPPELASLVTAYARGAELAPAVGARTTRVRHTLVDAADRTLVEVSDDRVVVIDGTRATNAFREIAVTRCVGPGKDRSGKVIKCVARVLLAAGATAGEFATQPLRALGETALRPPDLTPAGGPPGRYASAADVVTYALRTDIGRTLAHDPLVRLRASIGNGDTAVHQMRVGIRRLRADLMTFKPLMAGWVMPLRDELAWIAGMLGAARDAEVLRARLRRTVTHDPVSPLDAAAVARIDAELLARHEEALDRLDMAMDSDRYRRLVNTLILTAAAPPLTEAALRPAVAVLPRLVARQWHKLSDGSRGVKGAGELDPAAADDEWHEVRKRAKRARYATDAVAVAVGTPAADLGVALAAVTDALGAHQDAAIAADTWLGIALADPDNHTLALTVGRLIERERAAVTASRRAYPPRWADATQNRLTAWLR